jgi:hypothetical protein
MHPPHYNAVSAELTGLFCRVPSTSVLSETLAQIEQPLIPPLCQAVGAGRGAGRWAQTVTAIYRGESSRLWSFDLVHAV